MIKRITCYLIFYVCIFLNQKIQAQTYVIPDVNFKNYLVANIPSVLNSNQDLIINSAKNYTGSINCSGLNIQDLSGLQYFYKLTSLNCYNNKLSSLPALDSLKQIQFFWVYNNYLTSLPMTALKSFDCSINKLKTLPDLNSLLNLQELYCYINSITTVPAISNLSNLKIFNIENNAITLL
jgi:hypothetical protein